MKEWTRKRKADIFSVSVDEYNGRTEEFYYVCNCCVEKSQLCRYI